MGSAMSAEIRRGLELNPKSGQCSKFRQVLTLSLYCGVVEGSTRLHYIKTNKNQVVAKNQAEED
jgi:hypothetical protein